MRRDVKVVRGVLLFTCYGCKVCAAKRPKQLPTRYPLTPELIEAAHYLGSAEHKAERWWGGLPEAYVPPDGEASRPKKQCTTICPLTTSADRDRATGWVREALANNQIKYVEADQDFPKHIWYREVTGQVWRGFCTNTAAGQYKGWPIQEDERRAVFD